MTTESDLHRTVQDLTQLTPITPFIDFSTFDSDDIWAINERPSQICRDFHWRLSHLFGSEIYEFIVEFLVKSTDPRISKTNWCIAGSFAASLLGPRSYRTRPNDIDLYIMDEDPQKRADFMAAVAESGKVKNPILSYGAVHYTSLSECDFKINFIMPIGNFAKHTTLAIINDFDFNVCQFGFDSEGAFWKKGAREALEKRVITINKECTGTLFTLKTCLDMNVKDVAIRRTLRRYIKYAQKGFTFPEASKQLIDELIIYFPKSFMREDVLDPIESLKDYNTTVTSDPEDPNYVPF